MAPTNILRRYRRAELAGTHIQTRVNELKRLSCGFFAGVEMDAKLERAIRATLSADCRPLTARGFGPSLDGLGAWFIAPKVAYCLSNTRTSSYFSPFAVVPLAFKVSVRPSLDTARLVVATALPAFFNVKLAVLLATCLPEIVS